MATKYMNVRANAFGRVENLQVMVTTSVLPMTQERVREAVRVWDSVAGYYTRGHSLSRAAQNRIHKLAEAGGV